MNMEVFQFHSLKQAQEYPKKEEKKVIFKKRMSAKIKEVKENRGWGAQM